MQLFSVTFNVDNVAVKFPTYLQLYICELIVSLTTTQQDTLERHADCWSARLLTLEANQSVSRSGRCFAHVACIKLARHVLLVLP